MQKKYASFKEWLKAEYQGPYVATDVLIRYKGGIVLIERRFEPLGIAVPGGLAERMTLPENARKEGKEETGLEIILDDPDKPLCILSDVNQDPRAFICSVSYTACGSGILKPHKDEDAKSAKVYSYDEAYALLQKPVWAFEHHKKIMRIFLEHEGYVQNVRK